MSKFFFKHSSVLRILIVAGVALFTTPRMFGVGFTPTDGGLVVDLKPGDRILLSVMVDHDNNPSTPAREYFVENYTRYTGDDYFTYVGEHVLKLVQQANGATEPSSMSVWTVDSALTRIDKDNKVGQGKNMDYALGGISYTMWNDSRTLKTIPSTNDLYKFYGDLTDDPDDNKLCDVVFVIPTDNEVITSFDPENTLGRGTKFNGATGTGFLGMTYREVYWLEIPRFNSPVSYTNAALVTFNTSGSDKKWHAGTIKNGGAAYAYADNTSGKPHHKTTRTIFRLYILNDPINSCGSYFFAYDEQNAMKYRLGPNSSPKQTWTDSTATKKIYTMDRLFCMDRVDDTRYYQTGLMRVPVSDSAYYYVGWNDDYRVGGEPLGSGGAQSQFTRIRELPLKDLPAKKAPAGAYGRMLVDTTSSEQNLGVSFAPAGYFFKISTGKNIRMRQTGANEWMTEEMWTITDEWTALSVKATLMTGPEFSENDPGADIDGWSVMIRGTEVPLADGTGKVYGGVTGWPRITTNNGDENGHIDFILANPDLCVRYDNNGFHGMQIPDQHPVEDETTVTIEHARLTSDYTFTGWNTRADGTGYTFAEGTPIDLRSLPGGVSMSNDTLYLYATGTYNNTYNVALSFIHPVNGKRYFLTHPNSSAPRFARARHFDDWDNTWQGMANAENTDPNYISTFELRHPVNEIKAYQADMPDEQRYLHDGEFVLDPRHYTMKGFVDSLPLYEFFAPAKDEYLGLYYTAPNTIIANNTWAGLFRSTSTTTATGWPDFRHFYVHDTKLYSQRYVEEEDPVNHPDSLTLRIRGNNSSGTYVKYNPAADQFDGCVAENEATPFDISTIMVADEHYVVYPDSSVPWSNAITFDYHHNEQQYELVWSRLIGRQLMAFMMLGGDTIYFHPNRDKNYTTPAELYQTPEFRLSQSFTFIPDTRVTSAVDEADKASMSNTEDYWCYSVASGESSPMNVQDGEGKYIDIVDTVRIQLTQGGVSKIKEYRGRWKNGAGLKRYLDVIVTTKTYHYGPDQTKLVLTPELNSYSLGSLAGQSKTLNFKLEQVTYRTILDKDNNPVAEEVTDREDVTSNLALTAGACRFATTQSTGSTYFNVVEAYHQHITLSTKGENRNMANYDTLTIATIQYNGASVDLPDPVRITLIQTSLDGEELVWSVVYNNQRYFILAGQNKLIARKYNLRDGTLYKENSTTHLIRGSYDADNSDSKYITPWKFVYSPDPSVQSEQLTLKTTLPGSIDRYFCINGSNRGDVGGAPTVLTYRYANIYTNDNANFEEQVRLKYGADQWLQITGVTDGVPVIGLTPDSVSGSVFSWGYLLDEYSLLNNGTYPSVNSVEFGYERTTSSSVTMSYKARHEYSMLLNNALVHLCRSEQTNIDSLTSAEKVWKTSYRIDTIRDHRVDTLSRLDTAINNSTLTVTVTPTRYDVNNFSPMKVTYNGKYVNIVDTLLFSLSLQPGAPTYRFAGDWSKFTSVEDAALKIPLVRHTFHEERYDSLVCTVANEQYNHSFPNTITTPVTFTFNLGTALRTGVHVLDVDGHSVAVHDAVYTDITDDCGMDLNNKLLAEVRLIDVFGKTPDWCRISDKGTHSITVECNQSGIRTPRTAYIYIAYIVTVEGEMRFVNFRLTVSQPSLYSYRNNQELIHSSGASGDEPMANGMQQVHENRRVLYYYWDQDVELPVRERAFYGWWRWYRESTDPEIADTDIPDSIWRRPPRNVGKYNFPFRTIGDSVWIDDNNHSLGKKLVTRGRYTVFHYKSKDYNNKQDPPAKNPRVAPPVTRPGVAKPRNVTYAVDISNYYDNLPMDVAGKNQVDTARLDTMLQIIEPTLSLREVFELRPWTEMADTLDHYKTLIPVNNKYPADKYMEDHVVMAPIGNKLLLQTQQRYKGEHLERLQLSESLLGYYMHDDNWATGGWDDTRKDTMIWCGGWDADCMWYTYDPYSQEYTPCNHPITEGDDFLQVPARQSISTGHVFDTVYYCLRARSIKSEHAGTESDRDPEDPEEGDYMFNICRYMIIYHSKDMYGPKAEVTTKGEKKAIITNNEIEQDYEVLERLNFDYNQPGSGYTVYPHPLPWADASYGYTYPETPNLPHNRYHDESDFPNHGEYGLVNRIPYSSYWHLMEQHGGAENGYMIYCDGMASSGQVAALTLSTQLCEGQKMYFSGYVGNPSNQNGKSCPNFIFSVQGSVDNVQWDDITSYMTGDIQPSRNWYQIYFPILHNKKTYKHFRVRIYNVASSFDGNDFIIDDMCLFATRPPLVAYQANTKCVEQSANDSITQVVLRMDYLGFTDKSFNDNEVYYTVEKSKDGKDTTFVKMEDGYLNQTKEGDMIYGHFTMPAEDYYPDDENMIYPTIDSLIRRFEATEGELKQGYINELIDGVTRPVLYIVHQAKMTPDNNYGAHMALAANQLLVSMCAMTSELKVTNRMLLELNGEEQKNHEVDMCPNSTYALSLRVKGTKYVEGAAPMDVNGSCVNDWLLYGDTVDASSLLRYGHKYSNIVKVVKEILRAESTSGVTNTNQNAQSLADVNRNVMERIQETYKVTLSDGEVAYEVLADLVNKGFLTMYKSKINATVMAGDSLQYVVFPIVGTGSATMQDANIEVCPVPLFIKLKPSSSEDAPLILGGIRRDSTQRSQPMVVLVNESAANDQITIKIDSIMSSRALYSISLLSTDDPDYREGVHSLTLLPNKIYDASSSMTGYYKKGDNVILRPASPNNYRMRQGYNYTFVITMQDLVGRTTLDGGCPVGEIPFTVSVVPNHLRWDPKNGESNEWNNPNNWVGVNESNELLSSNAHFAPLASTAVIIPSLEEGVPYPNLPDLEATSTYDSIKQIGFEYNSCDVIRFMPGAAMAQQQRMKYSRAVVDMSTPEGKWALRSAPVKGMLSGDLFMSRADLNDETLPWEVSEFDANGRSYITGIASYWLSLYSHESLHYGNGDNIKNDTIAASAEWAQVTNAMSLPLPPALGWAVYTRIADDVDKAVARLPKEDDIYYYYYANGDRNSDQYEYNLRSKREEQAVLQGGHAGELAFHPAGESQNYTLTNGVASQSFVFGNPTMGYIDIWGFIADNGSVLAEEISIIGSDDVSPRSVTKASAMALTDVITREERYLPPMHAMVVKKKSADASLTVTLNTDRIVTSTSQVRPASAPGRKSASRLTKGIMTVTAINPVSPRCTSHLLIGQGYNKAVREGEDAILTTVNIDHYSNTSAPATPFNIYAQEKGYGLSIDLQDEVENVPISFYMSELPYDPVTRLWFTGVNNIDGELVLYDALTGSERTILDGICLTIPTPEASHETRYYIRRRGFEPDNSTNPVATTIEQVNTDNEPAAKVIRDGHVYTMFGQIIY